MHRCYSKVKVSYDVRSSSIEHQRYKKKCTTFSDVAEVALKNKESHKNIMGWIETEMKDVSLNIRCESINIIVAGGWRNYYEIIHDLIVTRRKGRPRCQRKQKQFKMPKQKSNNVSEGTTVEVIYCISEI